MAVESGNGEPTDGTPGEIPVPHQACGSCAEHEIRVPGMAALPHDEHRGELRDDHPGTVSVP